MKKLICFFFGHYYIPYRQIRVGFFDFRCTRCGRIAKNYNPHKGKRQ